LESQPPSLEARIFEVIVLRDGSNPEFKTGKENETGTSRFSRTGPVGREIAGKAEQATCSESVKKGRLTATLSLFSREAKYIPVFRARPPKTPGWA